MYLIVFILFLLLPVDASHPWWIQSRQLNQIFRLGFCRQQAMPIRFSSIKQSFPANRKLGKNKIPPRILLYDAIPQSGNTPPSKIRIAPSQKNVIRYHFTFLLNVSFSETIIFLLKSTGLILPLHC